MDARAKEFNALLSDITSTETKNIVKVYKSKIDKKKEEIKELEDAMKEEEAALKASIAKMTKSVGSAYDKIKELSFVEAAAIKDKEIVIHTKDVVVNCGRSNINLGPYKIMISNTRGIVVKRTKGKIGDTDLHHFFVDESGSVCFGDDDLRTKVYKWKRDGLPHLVVAVLWDLLSNVPQGSHPYMDVQTCKDALAMEE